MKEQIIRYLKFGNRFYGVEQTELNGKERFFGIALKKKRKLLHIELDFECDSLDKLESYIPKNKAIILVINDNSVLTKKVVSKTSDATKLVHLAFTHLQLESFYYEILSQGDDHFISICRKSYIDELLNNYSLNNINIVDFTLGNLITSNVIPFIDLNKISSSNADIHLENGNIIEIEQNSGSNKSIYDVNGLNIKNYNLLSLSASLDRILKSRITKTSFNNIKKELNIKFNQKIFADRFVKIGFGILFITLMINFFVFNHYNNSVNYLKESSLVMDISKSKVIDLNNKISKTEKMVNDVLKSNTSKSSYYTNSIIQNLPSNILLNELNFQPILKTIKKNKPIENNKNILLVSGKTKRGVMFSKWISSLERFDWVSAINILQFEDVSDGSSNFRIEIKISDDTKN